MITFKIDDLTPCLKLVETGEIYDTEVIRIKRKSVLQKFNSRTGWYCNWSKFEEGIDVYALVLKGTFDIQGLVALEKNDEQNAVHVVWGCTAPENNIYKYGKQKFKGVGGHLLAIAGHKSLEYGFGGYIYAEAMDKELFDYYINEFGARAFPYGYPPHPYRIEITEKAMAPIMEVYNYDDNGEEY
ncbi:hypothetical protein [Butyrivibrio sp. AE2032]|uniref:hypothetical protein n=1 Tax=Butyrivibrio sp. AE2032 TaxID=1458463 RepID=UPI000555FF3B|nr:hypothetical protein [Butyrivibrio sp. AE2032]